MPNYTPARNVLSTYQGQVQSLENNYRTLFDAILAEPALQISAVSNLRRKIRVAIASLDVNVGLLNDEIDTLDQAGGQSLSLAPLNLSPTTPTRLTVAGVAQTRTMEPLTPGLAAPNVVPPSVDNRPVVDKSAETGTIYLTDDDTIYDFGGVGSSAARDIYLQANNAQVRAVRGTGARRIGMGTTDSGFLDCQFSYCQVDSTTGNNADTVRPYWINCFMVDDPWKAPYSYSPVQLYCFGGNIVDPLFRDFTVYGHDVDPAGVDPHCDSIHLTSSVGATYEVQNPTFENVDSYSGGSLGILMRHTSGTVTVTNSTLRKRYGAANAFQLNCDDVATTVTLLWQNNTLPEDNPPTSYAAVAFGGVVMHANSDATFAGSGGIVNP